MKKVALVFVLAVFVPSLVLAWLAVRSLRDQQFLLERQQSLLYQGIADAMASGVQDALAEHQRTFTLKVASLCQDGKLQQAASSFDDLLRKDWPLAQVGFVVTLTGDILSPSPYDRPEARVFCADNSRFLANRESVEVYWSSKQGNLPGMANSLLNNGPTQSPTKDWNPKQAINSPGSANSSLNNGPAQSPSKDQQYDAYIDLKGRYGGNKFQQQRNVVPQQQGSSFQKFSQTEEAQQQQFSKVAASEAEFRQLIGEASDGTLARFVDNKLNVLFWCRSPCDQRLL